MDLVVIFLTFLEEAAADVNNKLALRRESLLFMESRPHWRISITERLLK